MNVFINTTVPISFAFDFHLTGKWVLVAQVELPPNVRCLCLCVARPLTNTRYSPLLIHLPSDNVQRLPIMFNIHFWRMYVVTIICDSISGQHQTVVVSFRHNSRWHQQTRGQASLLFWHHMRLISPLVWSDHSCSELYSQVHVEVLNAYDTVDRQVNTRTMCTVDTYVFLELTQQLKYSNTAHTSMHVARIHSNIWV